MGKKDYVKGMEAAARPFEKKFEELSDAARKAGEKVNEKLDGLGEIMDVVIDDLSDMQKKELYHLNTPFDLKEDLDDDEKEILAALLLRLSGFTENNEYQKKFIRSVNAYIEVKTPQAGLDISCIENIENIHTQKILMQTAMEYLYLACEDFSFLEELEEEVFEHFSVNRKGVREIEGYIKAVSQAAGREGIAEKYGFVPEEKAEERKIDRETFRLYKETTPYDLLEDLSEEEMEALCAILSALREQAEPDELQNRYLTMLESEAELDIDSAKGKEPKIDSAAMDAQKIILQAAMEYGYLGSGSFDFMESEIFDEFSVNKRGIRQIKDSIQKVCDAEGPEGIIEKYRYMGVGESSYYGGKSPAENTQKGQFPIYDGSDISEACADQVNVFHHYVVLKDYLVYCDEQSFQKTKIYCVHKQTGEKREISVDVEDRDTLKACNLCGYDEHVYLLHDSGIYRADVSEKELQFKKTDIDILIRRKYSEQFFPQCNEKYLVFFGGRESAKFDERRILCVVDLDTGAGRELLAGDESKEVDYASEFHGYRLMRDCILVNANSESEHYLYQYDLTTDQKTRLTELTFANFDCFTPDEYTNDTVGQYGKYVFCSQDKDANNEKYLREECFYDCIDMENGTCSSVILQGVINAATFAGSHYVYYLRKDAGMGRYDILTGKKDEIAEHTKAVSYHEEGVFKKKLVPLINKMAVQMQVVGKWIYYKEPYQTPDVVHKIYIDEKKDTVLNTI